MYSQDYITSSNEDEKDIDMILSEINMNLDYKIKLKNALNEINNIYKYRYQEYNQDEIKKEINKIKNNLDNNINYIIASMIKCVELEFKFRVRDVQIISLLICLLESNKNGIIEEVKTGEGKTIIIAFLAIIYCLKGNKVDILTSSSVLAERDSLNLKNLYSYYNLTCDY